MERVDTAGAQQKRRMLAAEAARALRAEADSLAAKHNELIAMVDQWSHLPKRRAKARVALAVLRQAVFLLAGGSCSVSGLGKLWRDTDPEAFPCIAKGARK